MIKDISLFLIITIVPTILFSDNLAVSTSKDEIQLTVTNVVYGEKALTIEFELKNLSKNPIWICESDYSPEIPIEKIVPVFRTIEENGGWIKLEFISFIMDGHEIFFEGSPTRTKFKKITSGEILKRKVVIPSPIKEDNDDRYSYFKPCKNTIKAEKIEHLSIVVQYYLKDVSKIKGCCQLPKNQLKDICMLDFYCGQKEPGKKISTTIYREIKKKGEKK